MHTRRKQPILAPAARPDPASWPNDCVTLAWLGHATVLINFYGRWILTDPALGKRIGVRVAGMTLGPRRYSHPALRLRDLPALDLLLISHAHMDHLDLATLGRLPRTVRVITHRGVGDLLGRFSQVDEIAWGQALEHDGLTIYGTGGKHWGARTLTDVQRGYGGFLVEARQRRVLFAGDTAYTEIYQPIGRSGGVDLAILPIGAYDPWIGNHANPEQAWSMAGQMGARQVLPVHHSTFRLSREPSEEPLQRLLAAAGPDADRIVGREIGETIQLSIEQ
jgi:L-ascorbate metabolism protein UlaG (beta-lactamase superfamily)